MKEKDEGAGEMDCTGRIQSTLENTEEMWGCESQENKHTNKITQRLRYKSLSFFLSTLL